MTGIISRQSIAEQADAAARRTADSGVIEGNPHECGTDAARAWKAAYERFLLAHTVPEGEGSA